MAFRPLTHAGCVVYRDDLKKIHYLLITSSKGKHWVLPKGKIKHKKKEKPKAAARRELKEEAGIKGKFLLPLSIQNYKQGGKKVVIQYYLVQMTGTTTAKEHRTLLWLPKKKAAKQLSFKPARKALKEGIEQIRRMK